MSEPTRPTLTEAEMMAIIDRHELSQQDAALDRARARIEQPPPPRPMVKARPTLGELVAMLRWAADRADRLALQVDALSADALAAELDALANLDDVIERLSDCLPTLGAARAQMAAFWMRGDA